MQFFSTGISDGTPTLQPRDYLVQPYSGSLAEEDDPFSLCRRRGSKSSKRQRKAMITHLLRLLLEPTSPVESEDETEKIPAARYGVCVCVYVCDSGYVCLCETVPCVCVCIQ